MLRCRSLYRSYLSSSPVFFFSDTATTEIYTLSLHDALPISSSKRFRKPTFSAIQTIVRPEPGLSRPFTDRKSTRLNSSHANISYAVFCLKKKKTLHFQSLASPPTPSFYVFDYSLYCGQLWSG